MTERESDGEPSRRHWIGYWNMIVQQTQNAFNDKAAQFILIPLAGAVAYSINLHHWNIGVESAAGLMIALPFVLFAPIAGWMSDRFSKRNVMFGSAIAQAVILLWICIAVYQRHMPWALAGFFALAVQSAFFGPAKIGINKELLGSKHLGFAASTQQMTAMLAILAGQIAAGYLFDSRYQAFGEIPENAWDAAFLPLAILTAAAVPALILAWTIPKVPAQGGGPFTAGIVVRHFQHIGELWKDPGLRRAAFGVAFFWGFAAFINLWSVKIAKSLTAGGAGFGTQSSIYMAAASLGMVAGFGASSMLLRRRIELGWVAVAGLCMTTTALGIAFIPPGSGWFLATLGLLAFFSAIFLAPLNAWLQDRYPPAKRGELHSAVNLQDCLAGIFAVAFIEVLAAGSRAAGFSEMRGFQIQMIAVALLCGLMSWFILRLLPADFVRVLGVSITRAIYRVRSVHSDRVPTTGGVLLLPNHVTFADAFFITAASPRPVRFVMDEAFMATRSVRAFVRLFNTVTIRLDQPRDALRVTIESLKNGDLVCLFPEGQITRTGGLCELRRGFELIAKKSGAPLVPMWCDGTWSSIFSFERGRFFRKIPYHKPRGTWFAFGRPLAGGEVDADELRAAILRCAADAIGRRFHAPGWSLRIPRLEGKSFSGFRDATPAERRRLWANGYQIGQLNAIARRKPFAVLANDEEIAAIHALTLAFPEMFAGKLLVCSKFDASLCATWVGGDTLRAIFQTATLNSKVVFHDIGSQANQPLELPNLVHCPGLAIDGKVVSLSMPDPPIPQHADARQRGSKSGTRGMLLPGWLPSSNAHGTRLLGPAAPPTGINLGPKSFVDAEGFLTISTESQ
jgi:acyl-[acyl-carrier-protein]-phospholipid O-acyltransferase/long-chain-fatty-acid--[acyl-carrier-protein] ligase